MDIVTAPLTQFPETQLFRPDSAIRYHDAIEIEFRTNETVYIKGDSDATLPAGFTVVDALIAEDGLPTITENYGFETGRATISAGTVKILDTNNAFSDIVADKLINNRALMNSTCRIYTWPWGTTLSPEHHLMQTFIIGNHSSKYGVYTLNISDINRNTKVKIFRTRSWRLNSTLSTDATFIETTTKFTESDFDNEQEFIDFHDHRYQHNERYRQDKFQNIRYFILEGNDAANGKKVEILASTDRGQVVNDRLRYAITPDNRGLLQSTNFRWEIENDTKDNNKQEIKEFPYLEGTKAELIHILYVGKSFNGDVVPSHWTAGIDEKWIDQSRLVQEGDGEVRVIDEVEEIEAKTFVEDEFLATMPAVFTITPQGKLHLTPMIDNGDVGAEVHTFDSDNVDLATVSEYISETKNVREGVSIKWGYNTILDNFLQPTYWLDPEAKDRNRQNGIAEYVSKTLRTGKGTESRIHRLAGVIYDRHVDPTKKITFSPDFNLRAVAGGSRHRINFDIVRDVETGTSKPLDREMTLIGKTTNFNKRKLTLVFQGYADKAKTRFATAGPQLTDAEIMANGIDIKTVPGAIWNATTETLSGSPELSLFRKYYSLTTIELGENFTPTWREARGHGFKLWAKGQIFIATNLDLTGRGKAKGGRGATESEDAKQGHGGYFGKSEAGGSIALTTGISSASSDGSSFSTRRTRIKSNPVSYEQRGGQTNTHKLRLSFDDRVLLGLPPDPGGSGGGGTDISTKRVPFTVPQGSDFTVSSRSQVFNGGRGGNAGAGFEFVSHPGSGIIGSGRLTTSGAAGQSGYRIGHNISTTGAAPGMPGVLSWVIDGKGTLPVITSINFHALIGGTVNPGSRAPSSDYSFSVRDYEQVYHGFYEPTRGGRNLWQTAHDIAYMPVAEALEEKVIDAFALESDLNPDGNVKLIVLNTQPTNANNRDLWITEAARDSGVENPEVKRFNSTTGLWAIVAYPDSIVTVLVHENRTRGAGALYFTDDGNEPPSYKANDLWHDELNDKLWRLGPPHTEVSREEFGYQAADSYLVDGKWHRWIDDQITLLFEDNRAILPTVTGERLSFPKVIPADKWNPKPWAQVRTISGEGATPGVRLDAGGAGTFRCVMERFPFPVHAGRKYQVTSWVKCVNIVRTDPARQGYGVYIRCFDQTGAFSLTNDIDSSSATTDNWFGENESQFRQVTEVIEIPAHQGGIAFMTVQPMVHAVSGHVIISEVKVKELTRYTREQITADHGVFNPFAGGSPAVLFLLSEDWDVDHGVGKQIEVSGSMTITTTSGTCKGTVLTETIGPDGPGSEFLSSSEHTFTTAGSAISFNSKKILVRRTTKVRMSIVMFAEAGSIPTGIDISGLNYTWAFDEALKPGW